MPTFTIVYFIILGGSDYKLAEFWLSKIKLLLGIETIRYMRITIDSVEIRIFGSGSNKRGQQVGRTNTRVESRRGGLDLGKNNSKPKGNVWI